MIALHGVDWCWKIALHTLWTVPHLALHTREVSFIFPPSILTFFILFVIEFTLFVLQVKWIEDLKQRQIPWSFFHFNCRIQASEWQWKLTELKSVLSPLNVCIHISITICYEYVLLIRVWDCVHQPMDTLIWLLTRFFVQGPCERFNNVAF